MNYQQAADLYQQEPTQENLDCVVNALCDQMTLREKTRLLHGSQFTFITRIIYSYLFHGTIFYLPFLGGGCRRLGIPKIRFSDGPKGVVSGKGTCFPVPIMRGASFDTKMEARIGTAMAKEAIAAGANYFAGICINLIRNPRGGRSQESYSEDPFLLGQMGATVTRSVQNEHVIACPKHYALNSFENLRFIESSNCDDRTLREIFLYHFKKCVDAGALSMMGAYNKVNGVYCCENKVLLNDILREEWGFDGFTMSDFMWGVHDTVDALEAGLDVEMPNAKHFNYRKIKKNIKAGRLAEETVDNAVRNILSVMIRMEPNIEPQPRSIMKCKEHLDLAEESARKGMVLLKNSGNLLPLLMDERIAVVGPFADTVNVGDNGSSSVLAKDGFTAFAGLQKKFRQVNLFNGLDPQEALAAAQDVDVVVACVGCDSSDEGEFLINVGEDMDEKPKRAPGGDRDYLHLHPEHLNLLMSLKSAGKKVIAVLYTGSVILTEDLEPYTDAIIMGYYGGHRFGNALAALLSGEENFSGKLPVSIAKEEQDYPPFLDIGQKPYEIDFDYYNGYYRFEKEGIQPAYPFGFGLSYTDFTISNVSIKQNTGETVTVSAAVKNIGSRAGAEVAQVYIGSAGAKEHRPLKMLRGFARVELEPGESKEVHIQVDEADLKFYDAVQETWVLDSEYRIYVGNSSDRADPVGSVRFPE